MYPFISTQGSGLSEEVASSPEEDLSLYGHGPNSREVTERTTAWLKDSIQDTFSESELETEESPQSDSVCVLLSI